MPSRRSPLCSLCRGLCHNPPIPTRGGPCRAASFRHTQTAANPRKPRMDAAFLCRVVSLALYPYSFTLRNGMEEVIGSIPIRSTNKSTTYGELFLSQGC